MKGRSVALLLLTGCTEYDLGQKQTAPGALEDTAACEAGWFTPRQSDPVIDPDCIREPVVGTFDPVVEWQWSSNPSHSGYHMVMTTPVVGNLTDDNGDGRADDADIPDIAVTSYPDTAYSGAGTLSVISGDGAGTHWSVLSEAGAAIQGAGGIALGDLEGDGWPEVCVAGEEVAVICLHGADGSLLFTAGAEIDGYGFPSIADMDGDGRAEVIYGNQVFDAAGALILDGAEGAGGSHWMSVGLDWDGLPGLELVAGSTVYARDGSVLWSSGVPDGDFAVGDFDLDGAPDIVSASGGLLSLVGHDGALRWQASIPGGGGGPPTVADFDGDGWPEVGIASLSAYAMFDTDGTLLWQQPTEDDSSSVTGSSVFDFEGDGVAEVVYADEHNLWIYDGATGAVRVQMDGHASGTLMEYPIIADVDGDDSTEIIVGSNDMWWEGWTGITVIGDLQNSWAPARPVWNQHAYSISNINRDLSVPAAPAPNWETWNSYRAGGTELGPSHWLSDLEAGSADTCLMECDTGAVHLYLPVQNTGLVAAGRFNVELRDEADNLAAGETIDGLESGELIWIGPFTMSRAEWGEELWAVLDAGEAVEECEEGDNRRSMGEWPCG